VANIIGLDDYLSFVLRMFLVFGIAFVLPVFLVALNLVGVVSGRALVKAWRPVILGAFVFAAVATPSGDPWTMSALALPMIFLFYVAAAICLLTDRRRRLEGVDGLDYAALADDTASPLPVGPADPAEDPVPVDAAAPLEHPARPDGPGGPAAPDPPRRPDDDIT
jgi:sec-independent protein translocase protein TatC